LQDKILGELPTDTEKNLSNNRRRRYLTKKIIKENMEKRYMVRSNAEYGAGI
jgi:hypothetical protein